VGQDGILRAGCQPALGACLHSARRVNQPAAGLQPAPLRNKTSRSENEYIVPLVPCRIAVLPFGSAAGLSGVKGLILPGAQRAASGTIRSHLLVTQRRRSRCAPGYRRVVSPIRCKRW